MPASKEAVRSSNLVLLVLLVDYMPQVNNTPQWAIYPARHYALETKCPGLHFARRHYAPGQKGSKWVYRGKRVSEVVKGRQKVPNGLKSVKGG